MINKIKAAMGANSKKMNVLLPILITYGIFTGLTMAIVVPLWENLAAENWTTAWWWLFALICMMVVFSILHYASQMMSFRIALDVIRNINQELGDHVVRLPLGWFTSGRAGSMSMMVSKMSMLVGTLIAHRFGVLISGIVSGITTIFVIAFFDWRISATLFVSLVVLIAAMRLEKYLAHKAHSYENLTDKEVNGRVIEFVRSQDILRASGQSESYAPLTVDMSKHASAIKHQLRLASTAKSISWITLETVTATALALTVWLAVSAPNNDHPYRFVGVAILVMLFNQPINRALDAYSAAQVISHHLDEFAEVLQEKPQQQPDAPAQITDPGAVSLQNVQFSYQEDTPVLNDFSLQARPGELVAIVGPSGCGKTTVTKMISRFYDVDSGEVSVGGVDVRQQTTEQLMRQLSLVFQDIYLFDDTILENIRIGDLDASKEKVQWAARLAGVTEIVERLPEGWDTRVGEGGARLSGGERQRVSIARALLKQASIVLFDEATAALDPENERNITQAMEELKSSATLIVIAHKLSTIIAADRIVVMTANGAVDDVGSHEELLARSGQYHRFWAQRERAAGWNPVAANR